MRKVKGNGFRFQRRIQDRAWRAAESQQVGGSLGRTGLRLGLDVKLRKYFSVGLPGTGLSYRTFFGRPVTPEILKKVVYVVIVAALCLGVLVILAVKKG